MATCLVYVLNESGPTKFLFGFVSRLAASPFVANSPLFGFMATLGTVTRPAQRCWLPPRLYKRPGSPPHRTPLTPNRSPPPSSPLHRNARRLLPHSHSRSPSSPRCCLHERRVRFSARDGGHAAAAGEARAVHRRSWMRVLLGAFGSSVVAGVAFKERVLDDSSSDLRRHLGLHRGLSLRFGCK